MIAHWKRDEKASRILPLSQDAISQIHSSKQITSLPDVVLSLLENSLDNGSSKVEIAIDFRRGGCTIEDNGTGISPTDFSEDGGLGKMYCTSKTGSLADQEVHGSTGTYLASLAALSLLSILSKHTDHAEHAMLVIHRGKAITRGSLAPPGQELTLSPDHGTRVTVRDLFGNMPVRVHQRALSANASADDERAWHQLKRSVVSLLLAWHQPCSVQLRDFEHKGRHLHLASQHPTIGAPLTEKTLNQLAGRPHTFDLKDKLAILFYSSLALQESRHHWISVSASLPGFSIKGSICLHPAPTKQCQFISIGIHPCSSDRGHNELYDAVNKVFANSSFGALDNGHPDALDEVEKDRRMRDRRYKSDGYTQKQLQGRKGVDRWAMFVLQVRFKDVQSRRVAVENVDRVVLKAIVEVLEATVEQWLVANHFRTRKRKRERNEEQTSPEAVASMSQNSTPPPSPVRTGINRVGVLTPGGRRATSIPSATTSKKRKVIDLSARSRDGTERQLPAALMQNGHFNSWSRIKSGKESFYDEVWHGKKPATAPTERSGSVAAALPVVKVATFGLSTLEAGALSKMGTRYSKAQSTGSPARAGPMPIAVSHNVQHGSSEDFGDIDEDEMIAAIGRVEDLEVTDVVQEPRDSVKSVLHDSIVDWTDPVTKQTYKVNARTGVVLPPPPKLSALDDKESHHESTQGRLAAAINTSMSSTGQPLTLSKRPATASKIEGAPWLPGFLGGWNNPVFTSHDQEKIPVASMDGLGIDVAEMAYGHCTHRERDNPSGGVAALGTSNISKATLRDAKVIKQVDEKYILCKMRVTGSKGGGEMLVLVDQHAASERVILEQLLTELCTPSASSSPAAKLRSNTRTVHLEKDMRFEVSDVEYHLFSKHSDHLAEWGILYDLRSKDENIGASQVRSAKVEHTIIVHHLPPGIAERCTLVPRLLIELLRSEIWALADSKTSGKRGVCSPSNEQEAHPWLARVGTCPRGILELLNSRACRSAVMFNDELSFEECENLMAKLGRCAFPFICAHGRVSMVPLVAFGDKDSSGGFLAGGKGVDIDVRFKEAFRRWAWEGSVRTDNDGAP